MKPLRCLVLALVAVLGLSACLQQEKIVKLKPDGSGTIEEKVVMGKAVIDQMKSMASGFGGLSGLAGDKLAKPFSLMDEDKLKDAADKMGDGVKFVSAKPITTPEGEGYVAIYAFEDINKVRLRQDLSDKMPSGGNSVVKMKPGKEEAVKFQFVKGSPASLKIKLPEIKDEDVQKAQKDKPQLPDGKDEMAAMMLQQVFKDMKIKTAIEFEGQIVDTNATYREGAGVTLAEMDFNKVLADPAKFQALTKANPKSLDDAKALMKDVDGIKVETQEEVMVKFK